MNFSVILMTKIWFIGFSLKLICCIFDFQGSIDFTCLKIEQDHKVQQRVSKGQGFCQKTSTPTEIRRYLQQSGTGFSPVCLSGIPDSHKDFMGSLPYQGPALLEFYRRPSELVAKVLVNYPWRNSKNHRRR